MEFQFGFQLFRDDNGEWHYIITINDRHYVTGARGQNEANVRYVGQHALANIRRQFRRCERCGATDRPRHIYEIQRVNVHSGARFLVPEVLCDRHLKDSDVRFHSRNCPC